MSKTLLALDLSTDCTGWAVFDAESGKLLDSGRIRPKVPGIHKMKYPKAAFFRILDMSKKVGELINKLRPTHIVVEEVNRGINRIGQKSLDALHFFVLQELYLSKTPEYLDVVKYIDSNGNKGWRGALGLKLSKKDKEFNKEARRLKKKELVIDWKVLAQQYVNKEFSKTFDVIQNETDADEVDAIALGAVAVKTLK